jgi:4,5-DOPA dioxygenase extradiol
MNATDTADRDAQSIVNAMPALFFGHGNPMHAITPNVYADAWRRIGERIPRPKAILSVSAHWYVPMTAVTISLRPRTIHDFGGFPEALFQVHYPAPGDPALAQRVQQLITPTHIELSDTWGLDHGTWAVLKQVYPKADVPVVQLSIDKTQPASFHFELGKKLAPLRDEGVLIIGSGNIVHNIRAFAWDKPVQGPYDWAARFEHKVRELINARDFEPLVHYEQFGKDAMLSVPTPEHYLPLLTVLGAGQNAKSISFPVEGVDGGSMSMLAVELN